MQRKGSGGSGCLGGSGSLGGAPKDWRERMQQRQKYWSQAQVLHGQACAHACLQQELCKDCHQLGSVCDAYPKPRLCKLVGMQPYHLSAYAEPPAPYGRPLQTL